VEVIAEALAELRYLVVFNFDTFMCEDDETEAPNLVTTILRRIGPHW